MIVVAVAIIFNVDRTFQTVILTTFPNYGTGLTNIENNPLVSAALKEFTQKPSQSDIGKPMNEVQNQNASTLPRQGKAPGFTKFSGAWINTPPLTMEGLKGNVVLVDFWTYTCINCIRTLPYVENWYQKYKDKGLVIIGVHTPEFEFEHDTNNVKKAVADFKLTYPVVQDNNYGIWQDYSNQYWPADYLVDKDGYIRDTHFGEDDYDKTEKTIQELLSEHGTPVTNTIHNTMYDINAQTPETYIGNNRLEYNVSPEQITVDKPQTFTVPATIPINYFAYSGNWTISGDRAMPNTGAKLTEHFSSQQVFLVMRPKNPNTKGVITVTIDGNPVTQEAGDDVTHSTVTVSDDRLYRLINLPQPGDHILQLKFMDNNLELYAFTFG
jgi:thiol-disulfide isomerase/thioredoxin